MLKNFKKLVALLVTGVMVVAAPMTAMADWVYDPDMEGGYVDRAISDFYHDTTGTPNRSQNVDQYTAQLQRSTPKLDIKVADSSYGQHYVHYSDYWRMSPDMLLQTNLYTPYMTHGFIYSISQELCYVDFETEHNVYRICVNYSSVEDMEAGQNGAPQFVDCIVNEWTYKPFRFDESDYAEGTMVKIYGSYSGSWTAYNETMDIPKVDVDQIISEETYQELGYTVEMLNNDSILPTFYGYQ